MKISCVLFGYSTSVNQSCCLGWDLQVSQYKAYVEFIKVFIHYAFVSRDDSLIGWF